jgi:glycosyltransferase involved in cell wall biosynthesis
VEGDDIETPGPSAVTATTPEDSSQRAAVVVTSWFPLPVTSGGRKRCVRLIEAMQSVGLQPHVVAPHADPASVADAQARGWSVHFLGQPRALSDRIARRVSSDLASPPPAEGRRLRALACDAAFVQLEEFGGMRWAASLPAKVPLVASTYNVDSLARDPTRGATTISPQAWTARYRRARMASIERDAVRRALATICVTAEDAAHFASRGAGATVIAPNGVDDDLFAVPPPPPDSQRVLFFGHLDYQPNATGLLQFVERGWPRVVAGWPHAELRVVGQGASAALGAAVRNVPGVTVVGFVDDLSDELAGSRAVIAPIRFGGGTRLKVLEALAAGRPVVGTSLAVERIGFEHGRHGLVAEADDGLGHAITELLRDHALATRQGSAGRELARSFRWATVLESVRELYQQLLRS